MITCAIFIYHIHIVHVHCQANKIFHTCQETGVNKHRNEWIQWQCQDIHKQIKIWKPKNHVNVKSIVFAFVTMVQEFVLEPQNVQEFRYYYNKVSDETTHGNILRSLTPGHEAQQLKLMTENLNEVEIDQEKKPSNFKYSVSDEIKIDNEKCRSLEENPTEISEKRGLNGLYVKLSRRFLTLLFRNDMWINMDRKLSEPIVYDTTTDMIKDYLCRVKKEKIMNNTIIKEYAVKHYYIVTKQQQSKQDTNKQTYHHKSKPKHQRRYQHQSADESPLKTQSPLKQEQELESELAQSSDDAVEDDHSHPKEKETKKLKQESSTDTNTSHQDNISDVHNRNHINHNSDASKTHRDVQKSPHSHKTSTSASNMLSYDFESVKGIAPKDYGHPHGNERLKDQVVGWRKENKQMSEELALKEPLTKSEYNQIIQSEHPLVNVANPNTHKINNAGIIYGGLNLKMTVIFVLALCFVLPSYFVLLN